MIKDGDRRAFLLGKELRYNGFFSLLLFNSDLELLDRGAQDQVERQEKTHYLHKIVYQDTPKVHVNY